MSDTREILRRTLGDYVPPTDRYERVLVRRDRRRRNQRIAAGAAGIAVGLIAAIGIVRILTSEPIPAEPEPVPAPVGGWVVFAAEVAGQEALYATLPGEAPMRLAGGEDVHAICPSFSPDGTRLVYGETTAGKSPQAAVVIAPFEDGRLGEPQRRLTFPAPDPSVTAPEGLLPCADWSSDGWLAMLDESGDLYVVDADGATEVVPLGTDFARGWTGAGPWYPNFTFEWSPDGTRIAVVGRSEIMVVPRTGEPELVATIPGVTLTTPVLVWSPDGSELLVGGGAGPEDNCCSTHVSRLWSISLNSPDHPFNQVPIEDAGGTKIFQLLWPSRSETAVAVAIGARPGYRVMLVDPQAGTEDLTAELPYVQSSIRLSPDGRKMLFVGVDEDQFGVMSMPLRGGPRVFYSPTSYAVNEITEGELAW